MKRNFLAVLFVVIVAVWITIAGASQQHKRSRKTIFPPEAPVCPANSLQYTVNLASPTLTPFPHYWEK